MNHDSYDNAYIRDVLSRTQSVALLGASNKPDRASYRVMGYLLSRGLSIFPVNPGLAGQEIHGRTVYASLKDIPQPVDMVDVFRASEYLQPIVDDVLALEALPKFLWAQIGVRDDAAAARAEAVGIKVVMNRCPAIEFPRLLA